MNLEELETALEASRERFLDAIEGLNPEEMLLPGVVGDWSVKDLLVHMTRWEAELVKLLYQLRAGEQPTTIHFAATKAGSFPVDDINARWHSESRQRDLEQALDDYHGVRNQTLHRLEAFSERDLADPKRFRWLDGRPLWDWIGPDTFVHENDHASQVEAWRAARRAGQEAL